MGQYCTLYPFKKNTVSGKIEESRLFKDLLSLTNNREITKNIYFKVTSSSFLRDYEKIKMDDLGEPELNSLLENKEINRLIDDTIAITSLNRKLKAVDKNGNFIHEDNTYNGAMSLYEKVNTFNEENRLPNYIATIKQDNDGLYIQVERKNKENEAIAKNIKTNYILNKKIETLLSNAGITISQLSKLEESLGFGGKVDYKTAEYTTEGIINLIQLANDIKGVTALPEEFAHFTIDINRENPLVERLFSLLSKNKELLKGVLGEEYEKYTKKYHNNEDTLIREAAGKLVYKSWFKEEQVSSNYKSLIDRVIKSIKNYIKKIFNKDDFSRALIEAQEAANDVGKFIMQSSEIKGEQIEDLRHLESLYNIEDKAKNKKEILSRILSNEVKKFDFYKKRLQGELLKKGLTEDQREALKDKYDDYIYEATTFINSIKERLLKEEFDIGITDYISSYFSELGKYTNRMRLIIQGDLSIKEKAYQLNNIKIFIDSVLPVIEDLMEMETLSGDLQLDAQTSSYLHSMNESIKLLEKSYKREAFKTFSAFLKEYFPEEGIRINTKGGRKTLTREDIDSLLATAESDITIIDRYIQSNANTNDLIIQIADAAIKEKKNNTRNKVEDIKRILVAKYKKMQEKGQDDSFMFEKHADGSLSNRYISKINWTLYFDTLNDYKEHLRELYKEEIAVDNWDNYKNDLNAWYRENVTYGGTPVYTKYGIEDIQEYYGLSDEQLEYYKTFMRIRDNMVSKLPPQILNKDPMLAVQIQKELLDRIKDSSPKEWWGKIKEAALQSVTSNALDREYGNSNVQKNFDGTKKFSLPIFFTTAIDESNLSRDTVSTMLSFADMAINYEEMSDIVDVLELGKTPMSERKAVENGEETIKAAGVKIVQKVFKVKNKNFVSKYEDLLETQLYGRYLSDASTEVKGVNVNHAKVAGVVNRLTALNSLAINALAAIAAVANDIVQVNSEVAASMTKRGIAYFDAKSLHKADKYYFKNILGVLGEFGELNKTSKLGLFLEKFDVLHNYENDIFNYRFKTSKTRKLLSENSLYFLMSAGAHWGETRTAIAQAMYTKVRKRNGEEISLWDAYTVKEDENGVSYLSLSDDIEFSQKQENNFKKRVWGLNHDLYGIYNKADKNAMQKTAIGAMVMMFRKYIIPTLNRRFGGALSGESMYNFDTNEEHEGYYVSFWKFIKNIARDSKDMGIQIGLHWEQMEDFQKSNIARAINELATIVILTSLTAVLKHSDWDKKDNPWGERFILYMARRLNTEITAFTPFGVFGELTNILKSPMAATNTLEGFGSFIEAAWLPNWFGEEIESGRFKGKSKGYRALMNSPFVPMNKTIYRLLHPEIAARYYNK